MEQRVCPQKVAGHQPQRWCKHTQREDLPLLYRIVLTLKLSKGICKPVSIVWLILVSVSCCHLIYTSARSDHCLFPLLLNQLYSAAENMDRSEGRSQMQEGSRVSSLKYNLETQYSLEMGLCALKDIDRIFHLCQIQARAAKFTSSFGSLNQFSNIKQEHDPPRYPICFGGFGDLLLLPSSTPIRPIYTSVKCRTGSRATIHTGGGCKLEKQRTSSAFLVGGVYTAAMEDSILVLKDLLYLFLLLVALRAPIHCVYCTNTGERRNQREKRCQNELKGPLRQSGC